jgi:hypothetical protein
MKQSFLMKIIVLLFIAALLPPSPAFTPETGATAIPDHVALTWTGDPSATMTISWRTDMTVTSGIVEYQKGEEISGKAQRVKAESRDFATDLGSVRLFSCTIVNLSPQTKYSYRVGDGTRWSETNLFSTAPRKAGDFKFLVFGDSQSSIGGTAPYGNWRATLHNAFKANPDAKFVVNVGDLVDYGQNQAHWNAWFAAAKGVIDRIPEMPVSGNHESYGSKDTTRPLYWTTQWVLPQNGPEGLKGQAYSYDYGSVHFVVLDSQQEEQRKYGDIFNIQKSWLDADLAATKAPWKIVFFHKPAYGVHPKRNSEAIRAAFSPILEKHHVDFVFNAHDHGIARTFPIADGVYMKKPSQGTIYWVSGRSGDKTYPEVKKMEWNTFFFNPLDQPNYFVLEVKRKSMTVKTVKQDGTVIDVFQVDKAKDVSSDSMRQPGSVGVGETKAAA